MTWIASSLFSVVAAFPPYVSVRSHCKKLLQPPLGGNEQPGCCTSKWVTWTTNDAGRGLRMVVQTITNEAELV